MDSAVTEDGTPITSVARVWVRWVARTSSVLTGAALLIALVELFQIVAYRRHTLDELITELVQPMSAATAVLIVFTATAMRLLLVHRSRRSPTARRVGVVLAATVIIAGGFYLGVFAANSAPDLPDLLRPGFDPSDPFNGIPASNTAFSLVLLNVGTLLLTLRKRLLVIAGQVVVTLELAVVGRMFAEFLYGSRRLESFPLNRGEMAVLTVVCLLCLGGAALLSRWDVGVVSALVGTGPGGLVLRAGLPGLLLLPLLLLGLVQGQAFFDRPQVFGLLAVVITLVAMLLVMSLALILDKRDRQRAIALDRALRARHALTQQAPVVSVLEQRLATVDSEEIDGIEFVTHSQSGEGVLSGDAHAVIRLDNRRLGLVLVDIAGHGADPAITGMRFKDCLVHALRNGFSPAASLSTLTPLLEESDQMATAVVADVDTRTGALRCAVAGHPAPVVIRRDSVETFEATGPLLHHTVTGGWEHREAQLGPDETLLIYTDGLADLVAKDGTPVDSQSVAQLAQELRAVDTLDDMLHWFFDPGRDKRFRDDVTLLILKRSPGPDPAGSTARRPDAHLAPTPIASRFLSENR